MEEKYKAILEQIASDLVSLQRSGEVDNLNCFTELGRFYDRMCANVMDFEDIKE